MPSRVRERRPARPALSKTEEPGLADTQGFEDNRQGPRRTQADRRFEGAEAKQEEEQRIAGRRQGDDRRIWPFGIVYNTRHGAAHLEAWLEENCAGKWAVGLRGADQPADLKSFHLMFETEADKQHFIEHFSS